MPDLDQVIQAGVRAYRERHLDDPPRKEELVDMVSEYREAGMLDDVQLVDNYIHQHWAPQRITGVLKKELDPEMLRPLIEGQVNGST